MIRVLIVDDHMMVIEGIKSLLMGSAIIQICGTAMNGYQALSLIPTDSPDVILMDINLPDLNGIDLCAMVKKQYPKIGILGLSTFKERSYITRMMEAGAMGYILKNADKEELEEAILTVHRGRVYMDKEVASVLAENKKNEISQTLLTKREKEVLQLICDGLTNQEIASQLFISILTVDSHRKNLLTKLGVKNTAAMVKIALENHLID
ncbi:MAG: response regulator transcription factor [Saprospiraceae bacterium]|nr:response regulator transcription factor [Saprospiraceae bacterium]